MSGTVRIGVAEQVAGFTTVQQELHGTLATIDSAEPAPAPHSAAMHSVANARPGR